MIIKVGGLEPLGPIGVYAYAVDHAYTTVDVSWLDANSLLYGGRP